MSLRKMRVTVFGVVAACTVAAAAAFACTNLATLHLSGPAGEPGDEVAVTGSSFRASLGSEAPSPVVLRWDSVEGAVLATAEPDTAGNIAATFAVPHDRPGHHVIVATQRQGHHVTVAVPARAEFRIGGDVGAPVTIAGPARDTADGSSGAPSAGMVLLAAGLGVSGLALLGAGVATFAGQAHRGGSPGLARVRLH